jgi:hypothetical protein
MASELVGNGAVPNVYVKQIMLDDGTEKNNVVSIKLELFDKRGPKGYRWSQDSLYINYMKVAIYATSNSLMSDELKQGSLIPTPEEVQKSIFYNSSTKTKIVPISQFMEIEGPRSKTFNHVCTYVVPKDVKDYHVYVVPYIDMLSLSSNLKLDLVEGFKYYFGPVTSEIIMKNGAINRTSTLFLKPNKKVWRGPVHVHENYFMAGPIHTRTPHPRLTAIKVENVKLIDNRSKNLRNPLKSVVNKQSIIGDLMYSFNDKIDLSGLFNIDIMQLVLEKFKFGQKIYDTSKKLFLEYIKAVDLRSVRVLKEAVILNRSSTKLGSPKIITKKVYREEYIDSDLIKEIFVGKSPYIRNFQFIDRSSDYDDRTLYKYKVELLIIDKTYDFMSSKLDNLLEYSDTLESAVIYLNNKNQYNYYLKKLKDGIRMPESMGNIIQSYYTTLSYFHDISENEMSVMVKNKMEMFSHKSYSPEYGEKFTYEYKSLIKKFKDIFKIKNRSTINFQKQNITRHLMPGLIELHKEWQDIILFAEFKNSYDYLGAQNNDGVVRLSINDLKNRGNKEVGRFFNKDDSLDTAEMASMEIKTKDALKDIQTNKNRFLAPLSFNHGSKKNNLADLGNINSKELTSDFIKAREDARSVVHPTRKFMASISKRNKPISRKSQRRGRKQNIAKKRNFNSAFSVSRVNPVLKINNLNPLEPTISTANYVGENSEFVDGEANYGLQVPQTDTVEVRDGLESALDIPTKRNKLNFDMTAPENFVGSFKASPKFSNATLKNAPNHFKAIALSRSPGVKNNILESDVDILKSPEDKVVSEMSFQTTQEVEMMAGYRKDTQGRNILNSPIWVPLDMSRVNDNTSTICRMKYTDQPELGMNPNEQFKMKAQNSIFILSNKDVLHRTPTSVSTDLNTVGTLKSREPLSNVIMYATSNIVTQNQEIEVLNSKINRPVRMPSQNRPGRGTTSTRGVTTGGGSSSGTTGGGGY